MGKRLKVHVPTLREDWLKWYLNITVFLKADEDKEPVVYAFRQRLEQFNEEVMTFLDEIGE